MDTCGWGWGWARYWLYIWPREAWSGSATELEVELDGLELRGYSLIQSGERVLSRDEDIQIPLHLWLLRRRAENNIPRGLVSHLKVLSLLSVHVP